MRWWTAGARWESVPEATDLAGGVGADIHPGLGGVQPEDAGGSLGVVGQHDRDSPVQSHGVEQLVLEHVQVVQPIGVPSATHRHTLRNPISPLFKRSSIHYQDFV